jgi:hypothetical protein
MSEANRSLRALYAIAPIALGLLAACGARSSLRSTAAGAGGGEGGAGATSSATGPCVPACEPPKPFVKRFLGTILHGVATDSQANILIHGDYWPDTILGPSPAPNTLEYVMKLDPDGNVLWGTPLPGPKMTGFGSNGRQIAGDGANALVTTGDGGPALSKVDAQGHLLWRVAAKTTGTNAPVVAVNAHGRSVVAGDLEAAIDWGDGPLGPSMAGGTYVASFSAEGTLAWQIALDGVLASDVRIDDGGNVYLTGGNFSGASIGPGFPIPGNGFAASLDASGAPRWVRGWDSSFEPARAALDGDALVLGGWLVASADFGGGPVAPATESDLAFARYDTKNGYLGAFDVPGAHPQTIEISARGGVIGTSLGAIKPVTIGGQKYPALPEAIVVGWFSANGDAKNSAGYKALPALIQSSDLDPTGAAVLVVAGQSELTPDASPMAFESAVAKLPP